MQISDDFNRADGDLGANWGEVNGGVKPNIFSQVIRGESSGSAYWARWIGQAFLDNHWAYIEMGATGLTGSGSNTVAGVRLQDVNGVTGYTLQIARGGSPGPHPLGGDGNNHIDHLDLVAWREGGAYALWVNGLGTDGRTTGTVKLQVVTIDADHVRLIGWFNDVQQFDVIHNHEGTACIFGGKPGFRHVAYIENLQTKYAWSDNFAAEGLVEGEGLPVDDTFLDP